MTAFFLPSVSLAETVAGQVCDVMRRDDCGIPGVKVRLYDGAGNKVADTITDASGRYRFILPNSQNHRLRFDKAGFQERPTLRKVEKPTNRQPVVPLVRENAEEAYYQSVAASYAAQANGESVSHAKAIAALDALDREKIHETLRMRGAAGQLAALHEVEQRLVLEKKIVAALRKNPELILVEVEGTGANGKIVLEGFVSSASSKATAEHVARAVDGVAAVENQIAVKNWQ